MPQEKTGAFRVMLVDDDPTSLAMVAAILRNEGYEVSEFGDSARAAEAFEQGHFDVLIADYKMPGLDGLSLLRRARLVRPDSIRMMLTGVGDYEVARSAINLGEVYRFMTKPVDELELATNTRLACEHLALVREVEALRAAMRARDRLLQRLEMDNPGITRVTRRDDGVIVVDDIDGELPPAQRHATASSDLESP
ncbi:MAG: response regulator [Deltaproteobacteria bacterium]|nr:response regulator [Deltaproteobacteria bacterium]MCB9789063.1 response regulator [Deltaproteobacteria bacterium]